jgi:site-specific DNA recombinase
VFNLTFRSQNTIHEDLIGATYSRISTAKQKDGVSLEDQDSRMLLYAQHNNIEVPEEYRFREQVSGFTDERSEYDKIRQLVRTRRINVLIVFGSDRYTRDPIHGDIFRNELRRYGCSLHIITEGGEVDIISPTGQYLRRQMDNFNWYWGKMIQQTTLDKKRAYWVAGVPLQQGFAKFGYQRVGKRGDARLEIVEEEAELIRRIFKWYGDDGYTIREIRAMLKGTPTPGDVMKHKSRQREPGNWSEEGLYIYLRDEIYAGVYYANRYTVIEQEDGTKKTIRQPKEAWIPSQVPAIVSRDLWQRCQDRLDRGRRESAREHGKWQYLLARRATCRRCGYAVQGNTKTTPKFEGYYYCRSKRYDVLKGNCGMPYFRVDSTDAAVWAFIKRLLENPRAMLATMQGAQEEQRKVHGELQERIRELDEMIAEQTSELEVLVRDYRKSKGTVLFEVMERQANEIAAHIEGLKARKERYRAQLEVHVLSDEEIRSLEEFAAEVRPKLENAPFELKQLVVERLNFTFELAVENDEKVVYIHWLIYQFKETLERLKRSVEGNEPDQADFGSLENVDR